MKKRPVVAALIFALSGCASVANVPPADSLGRQGSEGLAIVSLTLSGQPLERVSTFEYRLRPAPPVLGGEVERRRHFDSAVQHARSLADDGDTAGRIRVVVKGSASGEPLDVVESGKAVGRLVALPLPAGEYELYDWKVVEPSAYGRDELTARRGLAYRFSVMPGRATYLGNLDLRLTGEDGYGLSVQDKAQRDLALLRNTMPAVRTEDVPYQPGELRP